MHEILAGVGMARDFDIPVEVDGSRADPRAVAVGGRRRPRRWRAVSVGRDGQPGRRGAGVREGRRGRRRALRAGHRGDRVPVRAGRPVAGSRASTRRAVRSRRRSWSWPRGLWTSELARLAGASVALYPAEHVWVMTEEAAGAGAGRAVPARPRRLHLHPPVPRPVRHRGVRAERQADRAVGRARRPASPSSGRTGTTSRRRWPRPGSGCRSSSRSASPTSCARRRASRRTRTSSSGSCPSSTGCSSRPGLNSQGIIFAPGVGRAAAEWIVEGHPTMDLAEVDVARMERWMNQPAWLHERTEESLGGLYELHWPGKQPRTGRDVRRVPLYERVPRGRGRVRAGGGLGARELVRAGGRGSGGPLRLRRRRRGSRRSARRSGATREASRCTTSRRTPSSWSRARRRSSGLQRLATSDLDVAPGRIVYTLLCNERGGIEMDPTITRLGEDRFLVLAPTLTQRRTEALLRRGLPAGAVVTDVTSGWATLHLAGPRSRELLARLTDADVSAAAWPFLAGSRDRGRAGACLGVPRLVHRGARLGAVASRPSSSRTCTRTSSEPARTSGCATPARSRSTPRGWSAASGRGATTSGPLTIRSRPGSGSRSRAGRPSTSSDAPRSSGCAPPSPSSASSASTPPTPCSGTASRCSATASEPGTSRAPRSRRRSAGRPASAGSAGRSTARGTWRSAATPVPCRVSLEPFYDPRGERLRAS